MALMTYREIDGEQRTSRAAYDGSRFRVIVIWAPGRENFTYHYVPSVRSAAKYIELPGPTEGSMAIAFQELEDGAWEDWYSEDGLELEEAIEEGVEL